MNDKDTKHTKQTSLFDEKVIDDVMQDVGTPELNNKCARCNSDSDLQIHHIKYIPEITTTLCRDCHKLVHTQPNSPFYPRQKPNEILNEPSDNSKAPNYATATIKRINGSSYFYWNWREDGKVKSEYIGPVSELGGEQ
jgi:hypothetical protein